MKITFISLFEVFPATDEMKFKEYVISKSFSGYILSSSEI